MVITYRFGPCNCSAELVMDVRFITKKEDVVPCCPVGICPECGHTLTYAETIREVEPDPTLDAIAEVMRCDALPAPFVADVLRLAQDSEGVADLMYIWLEGDPEVRDACENDLYRMLNDRVDRTLVRSFEQNLRTLLQTMTPEEASVRCGLPVAVLRRMERSIDAVSYIGIREPK
jgi:hypothetical protein